MANWFVAEVVELARLGYLKINKTEEKVFLGKTKKYEFVRLKKADKNLKDYQKFLLDKLFEKSKNNKIKLSELSNKFYKHLAEYKKKLYENLVENKIFDGNPDKIRTKYLILFVVLFGLTSILRFGFIISTGNFGPLVLSMLTFIPGVFLAVSMPRKSAKGYALSRQIEGLKFYLKKGKWRHKIAEKHLFLEEVLPLAISLGVVRQLTKDMQKLAIEPPSYFAGVTTASLAGDLNGFGSSASSIFVSSPSASGAGTWSGGSGFTSGGGSVGGGFGGGGGGSW